MQGVNTDDQRTGYVHNPVPTDEVAAECHRVGSHDVTTSQRGSSDPSRCGIYNLKPARDLLIFEKIRRKSEIKGLWWRFISNLAPLLNYLRPALDEVPAPRSRPTSVRQGNGGLYNLRVSQRSATRAGGATGRARSRAKGPVWRVRHNESDQRKRDSEPAETAVTLPQREKSQRRDAHRMMPSARCCGSSSLRIAWESHVYLRGHRRSNRRLWAGTIVLPQRPFGPRGEGSPPLGPRG